MKQHNIDEHEQQQSIFDIWPDAEYPGLHRDIRAAIAADVQAERDITDRYRADWRSVCNALNTSPDSAITIVLAKIKTLKDAAACRARNG